MSDSEQCSNWLQLDLISLLVNFSCEVEHIMIRYDFLWTRWLIISNHLNLTYLHFLSTFHVNSGKWWPDMTSYGLDEWFWAMFKPTQTCPNFTFGQLFMWIGANNDQILLSMVQTSDSEQCAKLTPTLPIYTFGQLFMSIQANNDRIWLPMA